MLLIPKINNNDLVITPDGGFGGYFKINISQPITPKRAWDIYRRGFGDAFAMH